MVTNKDQVIQQLRNNANKLRRFGVARYGLFGSFARDTAQATSDVDILVEFAPGKKNFTNFMQLAEFLEELFGRQIDLVTPESLSPYLAPHILREVEYAAALA